LRRAPEGFRQVRERLVATGVHVTNWDNVGYVRGPDLRYTPHPEFAPVMAEAFRLRAADGSLREVADLLERHDVVSGRALTAGRRASAQAWTTGGVRTILTRPVYLGWAYWGREPGGGRYDFRYVNRGAHEPLTDSETFAARTAREPSDGHASTRRCWRLTCCAGWCGAPAARTP
jgi:hypothetical protein